MLTIIQLKLLQTEFLVSFSDIKPTLPMGLKASGVILVLAVEDATVTYLLTASSV